MYSLQIGFEYSRAPFEKASYVSLERTVTVSKTMLFSRGSTYGGTLYIIIIIIVIRY